MAASYGNIGCGCSWVEIDGTFIHRSDLEEVARPDAKVYGADVPAGLIKSNTQKALELLAEVKAGIYCADK
jgi:hypothetical protein